MGTVGGSHYCWFNNGALRGWPRRQLLHRASFTVVRGPSHRDITTLSLFFPSFLFFLSLCGRKSTIIVKVITCNELNDKYKSRFKLICSNTFFSRVFPVFQVET